MATIREANEINVLLRYILNDEHVRPADDKVLAVVTFLAERATRALHAGLGPDDVTALWARRRTPPKEA